MKITVTGRITRGDNGINLWPKIEKGRSSPMLIPVRADVDLDNVEPMQLRPSIVTLGETYWSYRKFVVVVKGISALDLDDLRLMIKRAVLRYDKTLEQMRREIEAMGRIEQVDVARRERIADSVRLFVWQRDLGKCVKCGSPEKLEFDHIIAVVKGGSNTERNIQLLCEHCNRAKGADI